MKYALTLCAFLLPLAAHAAGVSLMPEPSVIGVGDTVRVTVRITASTSINAIEGVFHSDTLEPVSVSDGGSIVGVWLVRPQVSPDQTFRFSGVIPGGYAGTDATAFSVILRANQPGRATVTVSELRVLRNDGAGSEEPVTAIPLELMIERTPQGGFVPAKDREAPEVFAPVLYRGNASRYEAAFAAVDKNTGIDRYEVAECRFPWSKLAWRPAESPYVMRDQYRTSDLYVRAIDRAGNVRPAVLHRVAWLRPYEWLALVILSMIGFVWFHRRTL